MFQVVLNQEFRLALLTQTFQIDLPTKFCFENFWNIH